MGKKNHYGEGTKEKVISGLVWTFGERILAQGVSFVLSIILARMLLPSEYGLIAMVMVFINIANVFTSTGFGEALVQKKMQMIWIFPPYFSVLLRYR